MLWAPLSSTGRFPALTGWFICRSQKFAPFRTFSRKEASCMLSLKLLRKVKDMVHQPRLSAERIPLLNFFFSFDDST